MLIYITYETILGLLSTDSFEPKISTTSKYFLLSTYCLLHYPNMCKNKTVNFYHFHLTTLLSLADGLLNILKIKKVKVGELEIFLGWVIFQEKSLFIYIWTSKSLSRYKFYDTNKI